MAISELERNIMFHMRDEVEMEEDAIICSMLCIKEENQQMEMAEFLLDNPKATREDVLLKVVEIHKRTKNKILLDLRRWQ